MAIFEVEIFYSFLSDPNKLKKQSGVENPELGRQVWIYLYGLEKVVGLHLQF